MTTHPDRTTPASDPLHPGSDAVIGRHLRSRATLREVLDSDRRREMLRCLLAADGPVAVRTLVGRLADAEHDATAGTPIHQVRQRIHVSLCRTHLPLLEDRDVVSYDRLRNLVGPAANLAAFESLLDLESLERPIAARLPYSSH